MRGLDSSTGIDSHERIGSESLELVALRTKITGFPYYDSSVGRDKALNMLDPFVSYVEQVANTKNGSFILAPEYSLYFHPSYARPIELKKSGLFWEVIGGEDEVVGVIDSLSQIAKKCDTNIAVGTVCEKDPDTGFLHNTALVIDSKGQMIHRRRKFTGTHWVTRADGEELDTSFLWKTRRSDDGKQFWRELVIPSVPPEDKNQELVWRLVKEALATIEPFEIVVGTKKLKAALSICAEIGSGTDYFLNKLGNANLDFLMRTAYEGDDRLLERTQLVTTDRMFKSDLLAKWRFSEVLQKMVEGRVIKSSGTILISDSAFKGSAGVFPVSEETVLSEPVVGDDCVSCLVKF